MDLRERQQEIRDAQRELRDLGRGMGVRFVFGDANRVELQGGYLAHVDPAVLRQLLDPLSAHEIPVSIGPSIIRAVVRAYEVGLAQGEASRR